MEKRLRFQVRLGDPALAEQSFQASGEALRWLKEQTLLHFPEAEFAPERNQTDVDAEAILDDLYASRISGSIEWIWDGGFFASLGGRKKAEAWRLKTVTEAIEWLRQEACRSYPKSRFGRKYGGFV
jgi:hypothetical protein